MDRLRLERLHAILAQCGFKLAVEEIFVDSKHPDDEIFWFQIDVEVTSNSDPINCLQFRDLANILKTNHVLVRPVGETLVVTVLRARLP